MSSIGKLALVVTAGLGLVVLAAPSGPPGARAAGGMPTASKDENEILDRLFELYRKGGSAREIELGVARMREVHPGEWDEAKVENRTQRRYFELIRGAQFDPRRMERLRDQGRAIGLDELEVLAYPLPPSGAEEQRMVDAVLGPHPSLHERLAWARVNAQLGSHPLRAQSRKRILEAMPGMEPESRPWSALKSTRTEDILEGSFRWMVDDAMDENLRTGAIHTLFNSDSSGALAERVAQWLRTSGPPSRLRRLAISRLHETRSNAPEVRQFMFDLARKRAEANMERGDGMAYFLLHDRPGFTPDERSEFRKLLFDPGEATSIRSLALSIALHVDHTLKLGDQTCLELLEQSDGLEFRNQLADTLLSMATPFSAGDARVRAAIAAVKREVADAKRDRARD